MECQERYKWEILIGGLELAVKNATNPYVKNMNKERLERAKRALAKHKETCRNCNEKEN